MKLRVLSILLCCALSSCATNTNEMNAAPVVSMKEIPKKNPVKHTVQVGETIYSIAWAYDKDYKDIAKDNNIAFPYILKSGQVLRLTSKPQPTKVAKKAPSKPTPKQVSSVQSAKSGWLWPVSGKVVQSFSDAKGNPHKGIDIVNQTGTPILATSAGKVVYSGDSLRGYGNLVILKHENDYLSAYAHNSELFVKEGQYVTRGQKIASMGSSESDFTKLHFEIRKNGQPIDPMDKLPPAG